jgi:hypothetical protein
MARPATFRKADVERAVAGVQARGLHIAEVVVNREGVIRVLTGPQEKEALSPLEQWERDHGHGEA